MIFEKHGTWSGLIRHIRFPVMGSITVIAVVMTGGFYWLKNAELNYYMGIARINWEQYNSVDEFTSFGLMLIVIFASW